jgi:hypothetical protein
MSDLIRNLYDYSGDFFVVVRLDGIFLVNSPEEQEEVTGVPARETQLCIFTEDADAVRYMELCPASDAYVMEIKLEKLWEMLSRINSLSVTMFNVPVRVDVAQVRGDKLVIVDTLYSAFAVQS